jgi:hypothetical protein
LVATDADEGHREAVEDGPDAVHGQEEHAAVLRDQQTGAEPELGVIDRSRSGVQRDAGRRTFRSDRTKLPANTAGSGRGIN